MTYKMIFAACAVNYIDQRNGGPAVQVANVLGGNASNDDKNVRHMNNILFVLPSTALIADIHII